MAVGGTVKTLRSVHILGWIFLSISNILIYILLLDTADGHSPKCRNSSLESGLGRNASYPEVRVSTLVPLLSGTGLNDPHSHLAKARNLSDVKSGKFIIPNFLELLRFECSAKYRVQWGFQSIPWITWDTWTTVFRPKTENESNIYSATIEFHKVQETSLQTRIPICYSAQDPCIQTALVPRSRLANAVEITIENGSRYGIDSKSDKEHFGTNQNCSLNFGYDPKSQKFYCQETDSDPERVKVSGKIFLRACPDPITCDSLVAESNCTAKPLISIKECTIQNRCRMETAFAGGFAGVAVCHSGKPEHSAAIPYFPSLASHNSSFNRTSRYLNWDDADPNDMLQLPSLDEPVYTHQKLSLICNASYFYLGSGMHFTLAKIDPLVVDVEGRGEGENSSGESSTTTMASGVLENNDNGSSEEVELEQAKEFIKYEEANIGGIGTKLPVIRSLELNDFVFTTVGMYELSCNAPVWNSTKWAKKSLKITVKKSILPIFDGGNSTVKQYYAPYKRLECVAYGIPKPTVTWSRDGGPVPGKISLITGEQNQTFVWAILVFPKLEYGINGNFTCSAANVAGSVQKSFVIIPPVAAKSQSIALSILVGLALLITVLIPLILFLMWKVRHQRRFIHDLTQEEVDEFINGKPDYIPFQCDMSTYAYYLPYDVNFEIPRESLDIDLEKILGSGEYGLVVYGLYKNANPVGSRAPIVKPVAIKTTKPLESGKEYFKALLSELKIMTYIGTHHNVVNLVGACTANIKKREVYIATEYCENGSLLAYLRMNRYSAENPCFYTELAHLKRSSSLIDETSFTNLSAIEMQNEKKVTLPDIQYVKMEDLGNLVINPEYENIRVIKQEHLIQWAYDIACGMEFLASRKVIHGDLAARNVLLTRSLTAKICDFGLSRQLYHYTYYTKTVVTPLPLKWLAIECLQNFQFSIESDIWAYGVTLFEIFTIGEVPYSSVQMSGDEFLKALKHGMRLNKPAHAPVDIFRLMMQCWKYDRKQRPTFPDIVKFLEPRLPNGGVKEDVKTTESHPAKLIEKDSSLKRKPNCVHPLNFQKYVNLPPTVEEGVEA